LTKTTAKLFDWTQESIGKWGRKIIKDDQNQKLERAKFRITALLRHDITVLGEEPQCYGCSTEKSKQ